MSEEANSRIYSTGKNTRDTKPTTFPPTVALYLVTTRQPRTAII